MFILQVVQVVEAAQCTCADFADAGILATGCSDFTVRLWKLSRQHGPLSITLSHIMRVHTAEVLMVVACRAWSIVVSASQDGSAAVWDLNRGIYVRSIWHREDKLTVVEPMNLVAVNESTVSNRKIVSNVC